MIAPDEESVENAPDQIRSDQEVDNLSPEDVIAIVGEAGIVGLGGATFPDTREAKRAKREDCNHCADKRR